MSLLHSAGAAKGKEAELARWLARKVAREKPGYHSGPHYHDSEQINDVIEGEFWFYVEDQGYRCVKGDAMRTPRNKVHWAWNRGDGCVRPGVPEE
jgi:gentisate 1,2-dioxygenase